MHSSSTCLYCVAVCRVFNSLVCLPEYVWLTSGWLCGGIVCMKNILRSALCLQPSVRFTLFHIFNCRCFLAVLSSDLFFRPGCRSKQWFSVCADVPLSTLVDKSEFWPVWSHHFPSFTLVHMHMIIVFSSGRLPRWARCLLKVVRSHPIEPAVFAHLFPPNCVFF